MKILVAFLKARARITSSTNHKGWESLSKESKILRRIVHIVAVIFSFKSTLIKQSSLPRSWLLGGSPQPTIDRALGVLTGLPRPRPLVQQCQTRCFLTPRVLPAAATAARTRRHHLLIRQKKTQLGDAKLSGIGCPAIAEVWGYISSS